ncbi:molybdenum cofactor sulfurase [Scaptodrosophila lebanonensis]|uniref:Molybdenum cofactor sulfurase n=1 Tax=Drosophila lebanonensis TaxID=7225 RepID=A0A6J2U0S9_DROLE|nr:molybdenum cofactor sulfurase [Scaptodrosophila lebanonensis]
MSLHTTYKAEFSAEERAQIDKEFNRLADTTYLDHAGTTLYAESQVAAAAKELQRNVICNPHTCRATGDYVDQVRYKILEFFNTDADDYHVIFTANATAALRIVAESFQFAEEAVKNAEVGNFYYCQENHTSVLGMRALVRERCRGVYVLTQAEIAQNITTSNGASKAPGNANSLVVFSAQCNFSGYKMPLGVIEQVQQRGLCEQGKCVWSNDLIVEQPQLANHYVLLDAASYVATNFLDLQRHRPDFVCVSFYKIFGYPTGVGALLVSRRGAAVLRKGFYGGGTINYAYPHTMEHQPRSTFHERFEDGTLPFLSIVELLQGFRTLQRLVPPTREPSVRTMERISRHVHALAQYCEQQLKQMRHANGTPLITFYNHTGYENRATQGGIVTFNVRTDSGGFVGFGEIACMAALHRILLRTGCFCNVGACQAHLQLDEDTMDAIYKRAGRICGDYYDLLNGRPTGAVRLSFGYMTRQQDVERVLEMLRSCYLAKKPQQRMSFIEAQVDQLPAVLQQRARILRPRVLQLAVYPVKSCAAFKIGRVEAKGDSAMHMNGQIKAEETTPTRWPLTTKGLQYDRQWMIVDVNGMAVTQKKCVELCRIQPRIVADHLELHFGESDRTVSVPLSLQEQAKSSARCLSKVCRQPIEGYDCGDEVGSWLSEMLGVEGLRLLRQSRQRVAPKGSSSAEGSSSPSSKSSPTQLSLVNQAQFLLINCASVRSLQLDEPLEDTVDRFRANIVIDTETPFDELSYTQLRIGPVDFNVDGVCQRCDIICINQSTGERTPGTLTTISRMQSGMMKFGIYISQSERDADLKEQEMYLSIGDALMVSY